MNAESDTRRGLAMGVVGAIAIVVVFVVVFTVVQVQLAPLHREWVAVIGLIASLLAGAVLLIAGGTKVADLGDWRAQAAGLGIPSSVSMPVPFVELAVGALLVVGVGWPTVPLVAVVMYAAFSLVIAWVLRLGRHPRCACFGAWSRSEIAPRDLIRNALLVGLSVLALLR